MFRIQRWYYISKFESIKPETSQIHNFDNSVYTGKYLTSVAHEAVWLIPQMETFVLTVSSQALKEIWNSSATFPPVNTSDIAFRLVFTLQKKYGLEAMVVLLPPTSS